MPLSATRSSELARIAAEAAGADTSTVGFTVTHGRAGSGPPRELASHPAGVPHDPWPTDYSYFSAAGLSMSASTWPSASTTFTGPIEVGGVEADREPGGCSYAGLTVPNPGFLKESTRRIDVLVTLGSTRWAPSHRDCLMNTLVTDRLTSLALERAGGPVLYLHTPVAPFQDQHVSERGDGSSERLRDAIGHCVRMSVGVDPNLPTARLDFEEGLAALAEEYGLGLKLDDRRFNRVRGEWFTIRGFNRERYRQERNRLFPDASPQPPRRALVATMVGQARVGVTPQAIGALRAAGLGVLAASTSSMRGITFMHFVLPARDDGGPPLPAWSGGWDDALATLAERCAAYGEPATNGRPVTNGRHDDHDLPVGHGLAVAHGAGRAVTHGSGHDGTGHLTGHLTGHGTGHGLAHGLPHAVTPGVRRAVTHAGPLGENLVTDHKFAISEPVRCSYPQSSRHTGASTTGRIPYPLWLRWEVPHRTVHTPALLADVQANLRPYAQQCEVAYAQSRLVRGEVVRGLAKLIVVLDHSHRDHTEAQRLLTDVAERAQEQTLKKLLTERDVEAGRTRLRMSPRERWLAYTGLAG